MDDHGCCDVLYKMGKIQDGIYESILDENEK